MSFVVVLMLAVAALALGGCQNEENTNSSVGSNSYGPYDRSVDEVGTLIVDYCTYGAVSAKQLSGCLYHVSADEIEVLDTPAASYALTGQGAAECGPEAGPFCGPGKEQDRALEKALSLP